MKDLLRMYEEDLLRAILEFGTVDGEAETKDLLDDLGEEQDLFEKALSDLEKKELITRKGTNVILTLTGKEAAKKIYSKHKYIEEYFKEVFNETDVHLLAHALEHCVSDSILAKMKGELALIGETRNLSELSIEDEATIIAISTADKKLFSRLLGLGLFPGSKIKVFEKLRNQLVVEVEERKIALDKSVADMVLISKDKEKVI